MPSPPSHRHGLLNARSARQSPVGAIMVAGPVGFVPAIGSESTVRVVGDPRRCNPAKPAFSPMPMRRPRRLPRSSRATPFPMSVLPVVPSHAASPEHHVMLHLRS
jgi:hypothetical protein